MKYTLEMFENQMGLATLAFSVVLDTDTVDVMLVLSTLPSAT